MSRFINKEHLAWVHELNCCLQFRKDCQGGIHAHHLMKPWQGHRGMGLKATDKNIIPLCAKHHHDLHQRGNEWKFFEEIAGYDLFGQNTAKLLWIISPAFNGEMND